MMKNVRSVDYKTREKIGGKEDWEICYTFKRDNKYLAINFRVSSYNRKY